MPLLSDEQLQEINEKVHWKIEKSIISEISYWNNGYIYTIKCYIKKVNQLNGTMEVLKEDNYEKANIPINTIVNVE